jgi:hypothetical protein
LTGLPGEPIGDLFSPFADVVPYMGLHLTVVSYPTGARGNTDSPEEI